MEAGGLLGSAKTARDITRLQYEKGGAKASRIFSMRSARTSRRTSSTCKTSPPIGRRSAANWKKPWAPRFTLMSARARSLGFGIVVGVQLVSGAAFVSACHPSPSGGGGHEHANAARPEGVAQARRGNAGCEDRGSVRWDLRWSEDSVLTSGVVSLDDQRSGHVFTPVTAGRVIKILAQAR